MIGEGAIFTAIQTVWTNATVGSQPLGVAVPGGLWSQSRVPDETTGPYAVVTIVAKDPEFNSSKVYLQKFTVEIKVWSAAGLTDAESIRALIDAPFGRDTMIANFGVSGARTLDWVPLAPSVEEDDATLQSNDVFVTGLKWELWLQATR